MLLRFGSVQVDTKRLPAVNGLYVYPPVSEGRPVLVNITLVSDKRAVVGQWAARLGVPVVEELRPLYEGDVRPLEVAAEVETDGYRVRVYIRTAAPADTAEDVDRMPTGKAAGLASIVADAADPNTVVWVVDPKADAAGGAP